MRTSTLKSGFLGVALFVVTIIFASTQSFSEVKRFYEPIVLNGNNFMPDYDQAALKAIRLFSYDATLDSWKEIPSQIDERADSTWRYFEETDSLFDFNDELVFLAKDCGDYAPPERWIDDTLSIAYPRFEVAVIDTVALDTGYVYVFRMDSATVDTTEDYIEYDRENDRIISKYYEYGHDLQGLFTNLLIPTSAGGDSIDFLDRLKLRLTGTGDYEGLTMTVNLTENNIEKATSIGNNGINGRDGKIRVIRKWNFMIDLGIPFIPPFGPYDFTFRYYPYWCDYGSSTLSVSTDIELKYVRYSFDLDSDANGMKLYSQNAMEAFPEGVPIDNSDDSGIPRDLNVPGWNWWLQTGDLGTILVINNLPDVEGAQEYLYYKDSPTGTNDPPDYDSGDTGYDGSWGDTGVKYIGSIQGSVPMAARLFFLGANVAPDSAIALTELVSNPLKAEVNSTIYVPVELASFVAYPSRDRVVLQWTTATETNNMGFAIERKRESDAGWQRIGFIKGHGTTADPKSYSFEDEPQAFGVIAYRLKQIDSDGSYQYSDVLQVVVKAPERFQLAQNYPNPFNPSTTISYEVPARAEGMVTITVYDMLGRKVRTLIRQPARAGYHRIQWDGRDDNGREVGTGMYIYFLENQDFRTAKKMIKLQ